MNYKLIDSLVQIISSLTLEERQNLETHIPQIGVKFSTNSKK